MYFSVKPYAAAFNVFAYIADSDEEMARADDLTDPNEMCGA